VGTPLCGLPKASKLRSKPAAPLQDDEQCHNDTPSCGAIFSDPTLSLYTSWEFVGVLSKFLVDVVNSASYWLCRFPLRYGFFAGSMNIRFYSGQPWLRRVPQREQITENNRHLDKLEGNLWI
jgi:hypothetical protein